MAHNRGFDRAHVAHGGGETKVVVRDGDTLLQCGHTVTGVPALSNPDRWWHCGAFRKKRKQ